MTESHPGGIPQAVLDKVVSRRGRLHAFPTLNPVKTALVVIDLDTGSVSHGETMTKMYADEGQPGGAGHTVWHELDTQPDDLYVVKKGASAFFPGKCNLHQQLQARGIESLLITGLVTNVCCESSARDACELEYEVTMVSDCLWGHKQGQHEATLATFYRNFGDVRPSDDVIELISKE